ncbi:MAG: hypothetical protein ACE141_09060 [Bryobacteraceae bacterium]
MRSPGHRLEFELEPQERGRRVVDRMIERGEQTLACPIQQEEEVSRGTTIGEDIQQLTTIIRRCPSLPKRPRGRWLPPEETTTGHDMTVTRPSPYH